MGFTQVTGTQQTAQTANTDRMEYPQLAPGPSSIPALPADSYGSATSGFLSLAQAHDLYDSAIGLSPRDVASMSMPERVATTIQSGLSSAASDTTSAVGSWIKAHPGQAAGIGLATGAIAGAQAIPGVDVGVDAMLGAVGAAMYAASGPEHRANITHALGRLQDYAKDVSTAKSPEDLKRASNDFADFVKIGGQEALDALGVVGGAAAGASKVMGLASKIKKAGGLDAVIAAGSQGLNAVGDAANSALGAIKGGIDGIGEWLDRNLPSASGLQPAIAGGPTAALGEAQKTGNVVFCTRHTLAGEEGSGALQGHTIERHVGQTEADLRNRLRNEPKRDAVSTFASEPAANRVVGDALKNKENQPKIQAWLADKRNNDPLTLKINEGKAIGKVLERGASAPKETSTATVVLRKSDDNERGFFVKTAYPSL